MLRNYQPSFGFSETAENIRFFFQANKANFWAILKPLLPYILVLYALDAVINSVFPAGEDQTEFMAGSIIATYFYTVLVISWYRIVILGPDHYVPMNPFQPTKDEVSYIIMSCLFGLALFLSMMAIVGLAMILPHELGILIAIAGFLFVTVVFYRCSLYFPAKAAGGHLSVAQSWALSKGMVVKMIFVPLRAMLRLLAFFILYSFVVGGIAGAMGAIDLAQGGGTAPSGDDAASVLAMFILSIPIIAFFYPVFMVFGASAMANYYLYALQNRAPQS